MTLLLGPPPFTGMPGTVLSLKSRIILAYHRTVVPPPPTPPPGPPAAGGGISGGGGEAFYGPREPYWPKEERTEFFQKAKLEIEVTKKISEDVVEETVEAKAEIVEAVVEKGEVSEEAATEADYAIMLVPGAPGAKVRAVADGTISHFIDSRGRLALMLEADDGTKYYYADVQSHQQRVRAGEVIAEIKSEAPRALPPGSPRALPPGPGGIPPTTPPRTPVQPVFMMPPGAKPQAQPPKPATPQGRRVLNATPILASVWTLALVGVLGVAIHIASDDPPPRRKLPAKKRKRRRLPG